MEEIIIDVMNETADIEIETKGVPFNGSEKEKTILKSFIGEDEEELGTFYIGDRRCRTNQFCG